MRDRNVGNYYYCTFVATPESGKSCYGEEGGLYYDRNRELFFIVFLWDVSDGIADFTGAWFPDGEVDRDVRTSGYGDCHLTGQFDLA